MKVTRIIACEQFDVSGKSCLSCCVELDGGAVRAWAQVPFPSYSKAAMSAALQEIEAGVSKAFVGSEINCIEMDLVLIDQTERRFSLPVMQVVSMALSKAHAAAEKLEPYEFFAHLVSSSSVTLPYPLLTLWCDDSAVVQECCLVPLAATDFKTSLQAGLEGYALLEEMLRADNIWHGSYDKKGGFKLPVIDQARMLAYASEICKLLSKKYAITCALALTINANRFYDKVSGYSFQGQLHDSYKLFDYYCSLSELYPIYSLTNPCARDDWQSWSLLTQMMGDRMQIASSNYLDLEQIVERSLANALVIKPGELSVVSELLQTVAHCKEAEMNLIFQADELGAEQFWTDIAVGGSCGQLAAGGLKDADHLALYNRVLVVETLLSMALLED
jgi:enolase